MEDHIRFLSKKLVESDENSDEFLSISAELQAAISEHIGQMRARLKNYSLAQERRRLADN